MVSFLDNILYSIQGNMGLKLILQLQCIGGKFQRVCMTMIGMEEQILQ